MSIPTAPQFRGKQFVPPDQIQRFGPGQVLHMIHYDTPVVGIGTGAIPGSSTGVLSAGSLVFKNAGDLNITSLSQGGYFSDFKQFSVYAIGVQMYFADPTAPPAGAPTAEELYDIVTYYSRFTLWQGDAQKQILWTDQLPAGGGVTGFSNTAGSFHLTNGVASSSCKFFLKEPIVIPPQKHFHLKWDWQSSEGGAGQQALERFNAATNARKLVRVYLHGLEIRDITNG